jgi:hypothetical protein
MIIALNSIYMEGRHFAVLTSISLWSLTYLIAFIIISNKLSKGNLFTKIASKFKIYWTVFYISILFPFLAGVSYNIGGSMEKGNSIAWGCYIQDFSLSLIIWLFIGTILFFLMIYGLINPTKLKFAKRKELFITYILIQTYAFFMIIIYFICINYFSGELSGKNSSCW